MRSAIAISIAFLALAGCDSAPKTATDSVVHRFGETITATRYKGEMFENGFGIGLLDVLEDSRCPKNVTCVWQGAVTVRLSMVIDSDSRSPHWIDLATVPEQKRSVVYQGYQVELIDVNPYPDGTTKPAPEQYRVLLRVTRAP